MALSPVGYQPLNAQPWNDAGTGGTDTFEAPVAVGGGVDAEAALAQSYPSLPAISRISFSAIVAPDVTERSRCSPRKIFIARVLAGCYLALALSLLISGAAVIGSKPQVGIPFILLASCLGLTPIVSRTPEMDKQYDKLLGRK